LQFQVSCVKFYIFKPDLAFFRCISTARTWSKMHIFGCRLPNYFQSKGLFFVANLKILVQTDSRALLTFFMNFNHHNAVEGSAYTCTVHQPGTRWGCVDGQTNIAVYRGSPLPKNQLQRSVLNCQKLVLWQKTNVVRYVVIL
jgi:hypothetical protein